MAHSGNVHGVFVIWRHKQDKTTIYDWGIYTPRPDLPEARVMTVDGNQLAIHPHPMNYKAEVICEARVPIFTVEEVGPGEIPREDYNRAVEMVTADLLDQIKHKSTFANIRQKLAEIGRTGKPKPPIEVVDDHDWSELWARTGIITG